MPEMLLQTMNQSKSKPENAHGAWRDKAKLQISHITAATKLSLMEINDTFEDWHDQEGLKKSSPKMTIQ